MSKSGDGAAGIAVFVIAGVVLATNPGLADKLADPGEIPVVGDLFSAVAAYADRKAAGEDKQGRPAGGKASAGGGIPARYRVLYKEAAADAPCDLSWRTLAAIGWVESRHGANTGPSSAGALGPMQFMPATWRAYGHDGDGDGHKNVHDPDDAIPAAAGYLCANGAGRNLRGAIWHYNHSWAYVDQVQATARQL